MCSDTVPPQRLGATGDVHERKDGPSIVRFQCNGDRLCQQADGPRFSCVSFLFLLGVVS
jgi:hypothetical protein